MVRSIRITGSILAVFLLIAPFFVNAESGTFGAQAHVLPADTEFSVVISAQDLVDAGAVDFLLEYDPTIVTYVGTVAGPLMEPISLFGILDATSSIAVDTEQLLVSIPSDLAISGSGELATVTFRTNATGGTTTVDMVSMTMFAFDVPFTETEMVVGESVSVDVTVPDTTAPIRSSLSPSGSLVRGTTEATLSVTTDEDATCVYSLLAGSPFEEGTTFTTTGALLHSTVVDGFVNGWTYTYYVRCSDAEGNENIDDAVISFSIQASTSGGGSGGGGGGGSSRDTSAPRRISIAINEGDDQTEDRSVTLTLTARDDSEPITMQISENESFADTEWVPFKETYRWTLTAGQGEKTVFVRFRDSKNNTTSSISDSIVLTGDLLSHPDTTNSEHETVHGVTQGQYVSQVPTVAQFTTEMGLGTQNEQVTRLQQRLREEGFFTYPTNTGYYGEITRVAVQAYQRTHGIDATGYVGPLTLKALNATRSSNEESELDLASLIRLFLALGIIPQEKADVAFAAIALL